MLDGTDFHARLAALEQRLAAHGAAEKPSGLTEPDPEGTERWEAGRCAQAEFVSNWHTQAESVIAADDGDPLPFGRTKEDPDRLAGIETGRDEEIRALMERVRTAIAEPKTYIAGLTSAEWNAVGQHPTRGSRDVEAIVERFVWRISRSTPISSTALPRRRADRRLRRDRRQEGLRGDGRLAGPGQSGKNRGRGAGGSVRLRAALQAEPRRSRTDARDP